MRRVAEGKAAAQAEAAEWKRKYELERDRNLRKKYRGSLLLLCIYFYEYVNEDSIYECVVLELIFICHSQKHGSRQWHLFFLSYHFFELGFFFFEIIEKYNDQSETQYMSAEPLPETDSNSSTDSSTNSMHGTNTEQNDRCCGKHGICSHEVLRNGEIDADLSASPNKFMRKVIYCIFFSLLLIG